MVQCQTEICEVIMYIEDFRSIVTRLYQDIESQKNYIDRLRELDPCLSEIIIENKYINSVLILNDFLIQNVFGELTEHVYWFLYDWKYGYKITDNNVDYVINTIDDFIICTQQIYNLPMKPKTSSEGMTND
jgi:hypothetical protein